MTSVLTRVRTLLASAELRKFLHFCVAGGVGFVVDFGILLALLATTPAGPYAARAISFSAAVVATWLINRSWTFGITARPSLREFLNYLAVQALGLICNIVVYTAWLLLAPALLNAPLIALIVASALALLVNYSGLRLSLRNQSTP